MYNKLTEVDLGGLANLQSFYLQNTQLTEVGLSGLTNLQTLYLSNNSLTSIEINGVNTLASLNLAGNLLDTITLKELTIANTRNPRLHQQLPSPCIRGVPL